MILIRIDRKYEVFGLLWSAVLPWTWSFYRDSLSLPASYVFFDRYSFLPWLWQNRGLSEADARLIAVQETPSIHGSARVVPQFWQNRVSCEDKVAISSARSTSVLAHAPRFWQNHGSITLEIEVFEG